MGLFEKRIIRDLDPNKVVSFKMCRNRESLTFRKHSKYKIMRLLQIHLVHYSNLLFATTELT